MNKTHIKRNFNRASDTYDKYAFVQREIGIRLNDNLEFMTLEPKWILDIGTSTGFMATLMAKRYPQAKIIGIDIAEQLCQQAKTKNPVCCGDAERLPFAANQFDLVISNLVLQWVDIAVCFPEIQRVLKPEGLFLFSTLGPDSLCEIQQTWATLDEAKHAHDFVDLHDVGDTLVKTAFADPVMEMEKLTFHYRHIDALLNDIKGIGAQNCHPHAPKGLMGKQRWQGFKEAFIRQHLTDAFLPLTYEVIYGHAWKPHPSKGVKADQTGVARFPLDYLRQQP